MTPKEKAQELYDKIHFALPSYHDEGQQEHKSAIECALIAVDEIIKAHVHNEGVRHLKWWEEVKQEIEKL